jgi:ubiquinol-cytochrome c reductase cytochrome b subunit
MILMFQLVTGLLLVFFYSNDVGISFNSVQYIMYEVNGGWFLRILHFNGANLIFIFLYLHLLKAIFLASYRLKRVWLVGILILLLIIAEAFTGYVLVWAQISF